MQSVQQNHEQDDELSLIAIWKVLVERKLLVIVFTTLTAMGAIYYTLTLPTIYKSEVLMVPVDNNSSTESLSSIISSTVGFIPGVGKGNFGVVIRQELARLKTRLFLVDFIISKNLKPILFSNYWDKDKSQWIGVEPSNEDAYKLLSKMITVQLDPRDKASIMSVSMEWEDPISIEAVSVTLNGLIEKINNDAKGRAVRQSEMAIDFLKKEIGRTDVVDLRETLYNVLEQEMKKKMLSSIGNEFVFLVIEPAVTPEMPENKGVFVLIILSIFLGIFFGSFIAIFLNSFGKQLSER